MFLFYLLKTLEVLKIFLTNLPDGANLTIIVLHKQKFNINFTLHKLLLDYKFNKTYVGTSSVYTDIIKIQ